MKSKIQKWGNSLAVRIPKPFAAEMELVENSSILMMVEEGALLIVPDPEGKWTLEALLAGVTEENLHAEWETGGPEGGEPW
jgi:antitoxin MazE